MRAKMKTCKAVATRFKATASGRWAYKKAGRRHLLTTKPSSRMRLMRHDQLVPKTEVERITKLMPYGDPYRK